MNIGSHGIWRWLTSTEMGWRELLECCPQLTLRKAIAITSFDSGHYVPSSAFRELGWISEKDVAYTPVLEFNHELPDSSWSEWYIFLTPQRLSDGTRVFVNDFAFDLGNNSEMTQDFWKQISEINPESFVADGSIFTVVTQNKAYFQRIVACLKRGSQGDANIKN